MPQPVVNVVGKELRRMTREETIKLVAESIFSDPSIRATQRQDDLIKVITCMATNGVDNVLYKDKKYRLDCDAGWLLSDFIINDFYTYPKPIYINKQQPLICRRLL